MTAKCRRPPTSDPLRPPRPVAAPKNGDSLGDTEAGTSTEITTMKIEAGKKYKRRDGEIVTIERVDAAHPYGETNPYIAEGGHSYTERGEFMPSGDEDDADLVEEIADEQAAAEVSEGVCVEVVLGADPLLRLMNPVVYSESPCRAALRLLLREVDARSLGRHEGTSDLSAAVAFARLALKDSAL